MKAVRNLVADDRTVLFVKQKSASRRARHATHPGLLEVRGLGIVELPSRGQDAPGPGGDTGL